MDKNTIAHIEQSFQTVIKITLNGGEHKLFTDYHQVCDYINTIEKRKALESKEETWIFVRRRYETLHLLYYRNPSLKDFLTLKEREAVEKETGLIEIVKGDREHMIQLLFSSYLDIEPLKRDWCRDYCKTHGLTLSEFELISNN